MNTTKLLNDKRVLYVVAFFAVTNLIGYLVARNYNAVLFFLLVSLIVKFFTQNISIILGSALILTNLVIGGKMIKESFEGKEEEKEKAKKGSKVKSKNSSSSKPSEKVKKPVNKSGMANIHEDEDDTSSESEDNTHSSDSQEKMASGKKSQLDYAGTIESAYDNLDKLLSSDALKNMSLDTQRLAEKQKRLMGSIKNLEPMMNQANKLLQGLDMSGINNMMSKISDMTMITGIGGGAEKKVKGVEEK